MFVIVKPNLNDGAEFIVYSAYQALKNAKYPLGKNTLQTLASLVLSGYGPKVSAVGCILHNRTREIGQTKSIFQSFLKDVYHQVFRIFQYRQHWDKRYKKFEYELDSFDVDFPVKADLILFINQYHPRGKLRAYSDQVMTPYGKYDSRDFVEFLNEIFDVYDPTRPIEVRSLNAFKRRQIKRAKARKAKEIEDKKNMYKKRYGLI